MFQNSKYVATKRCSHDGERLTPGDVVPLHWPDEAIEYLLKRECLVETTEEPVTAIEVTDYEVEDN